MNRPPLEVADLVRAAGRGFIERSRRWITWQHIKVLRAIVRCRTAALGGHLDECTDCGYRPAKTSAASPRNNFTDEAATVSSGRRQPRNLPSRMGGRTADCGAFLAPLVAVHEPPQTLRHFWSGRL